MSAHQVDTPRAGRTCPRRPSTSRRSGIIEVEGGSSRTSTRSWVPGTSSRSSSTPTTRPRSACSPKIGMLEVVKTETFRPRRSRSSSRRSSSVGASGGRTGPIAPCDGLLLQLPTRACCQDVDVPCTCCTSESLDILRARRAPTRAPSIPAQGPRGRGREADRRMGAEGELDGATVIESRGHRPDTGRPPARGCAARRRRRSARRLPRPGRRARRLRPVWPIAARSCSPTSSRPLTRWSLRTSSSCGGSCAAHRRPRVARRRGRSDEADTSRQLSARSPCRPRRPSAAERGARADAEAVFACSSMRPKIYGEPQRGAASASLASRRASAWETAQFDVIASSRISDDPLGSPDPSSLGSSHARLRDHRSPRGHRHPRPLRFSHLVGAPPF